MGSHVVVQIPTGKNNKTWYERQRGRKCDVPAGPFGETVLYRKPEVVRDSHQALEERWGKGVWLGHTRNTSEVFVATDKGITKAWSIRRLPMEEQ